MTNTPPPKRMKEEKVEEEVELTKVEQILDVLGVERGNGTFHEDFEHLRDAAVKAGAQEIADWCSKLATTFKELDDTADEYDEFQDAWAEAYAVTEDVFSTYDEWIWYDAAKKEASGMLIEALKEVEGTAKLRRALNQVKEFAEVWAKHA